MIPDGRVSGKSTFWGCGDAVGGKREHEEDPLKQGVEMLYGVLVT